MSEHENDPIAGAHPVAAAWFRSRFGAPTRAQALAWPAIAAGEDTLVAAPTGSGKTLAAFFFCLDRLLRRGLDEGSLPDRTDVLYVSPLKALGNDVHRNLEEPLAEIRALAEAQGLAAPPIRVAVRTGDTPAAERRKAAARPPHILVTTPESLYILLTSESGRRGLAGVRTVIIDEIHAIVGDKRGAHLALSLERLERLATAAGGPRPVRIGLSATQRPIEEVGRFLVGTDRPACTIVNAGHGRKLDLAVLVPSDELSAVASGESWAEIYDRIADLIREHRTTIVFVNTRRLVERVAHALEARLGEKAIAAHHGSLSRKTRLDAEQRLKRGELNAIVATASLELGIDVGAVDLVCQVGSPRAIRTLLQRVGRSGHQIGAVPKGRLFALTRDQLVECAALVRAARAGDLDCLEVRRGCLDILAQQVVAMAAAEDWSEEELFGLCRRAYPYADLERKDFDEVVAMLSDGIVTRRGSGGAHLHRDLVNGKVRGRRGARLSAITSGGAIPDVADYDVVLEPEGTFVGKIDEDFAIESMAGDIFLLGNASWQVLRVEAGRVRVADAVGKAPTVPFWRAEAPARTSELSAAVGELRAEVERRVAEARDGLVPYLMAETAVDRAGAEQIVAYVAATRAALGAVPTQKRIVAERFFDEAGGMQLVIHAPFGGRINRAWGLTLRKRFCRSFDFELQAAATDDGIVLSLGPQHSFPLETVFRFLRADTVGELLEQAVLAAPMFGTRWRWNATRALALLRFRSGKKVPAPLQRMRAEDLLAAVFPRAIACGENHEGGDIPIPDHPLVRETMKDCFEEAMDLRGLERVLGAIAAGEIETVARDTPEPSPMSHEILNANPYAFLDDAPLEERRTRAVQTRRGLPVEVAASLGALDAAAIETVAREAWPEVRSPDELHDALLSLGAIPEGDAAGWFAFLPALERDRRAGRYVLPGGARFLVAAERVPLARAVWPDGRLDPELAVPKGAPSPTDEAEARAAIVRAHLAFRGPRTAAAIAAELSLPPGRVEGALAAVESEGQILRGRFSPGLAEREIEWCDRALLARIHRLTIGRLRREIEPVSCADFIRFLLRWQHVAPGTQLHGEEGLARVIEQLEGFEVAAGAWEGEIFRARIAAYQPGWLDALCLSGEVAWGRFAGRRTEKTGKPAQLAGRAAPVGIALREDLPYLLEPPPEGAGDALSHAARDVYDALAARGASFLPEIVAASRRLRTEVEDALCELVAAGLVAADGFQALRSLLSRSRRDRVRRMGRTSAGPRPRNAQGRWALLHGTVPSEPVNQSLAAPRSVSRPMPASSEVQQLSQVAGPPSPCPRPRSLRDALANRLIHRPSPPPPAEALERAARRLLERYGVVFRDILAREPRAPAWRELLQVYRRLEARGEIRGGRFVAGPGGEHFALPATVESLRAVRRLEPRGEVVRVFGGDPLNLVGILTPGPRVPASLGKEVRYRDGVPVVEDEGAPAPVVVRGVGGSAVALRGGSP